MALSWEATFWLSMDKANTCLLVKKIEVLHHHCSLKTTFRKSIDKALWIVFLGQLLFLVSWLFNPFPLQFMGNKFKHGFQKWIVVQPSLIFFHELFICFYFFSIVTLIFLIRIYLTFVYILLLSCFLWISFWCSGQCFTQWGPW